MTQPKTIKICTGVGLNQLFPEWITIEIPQDNQLITEWLDEHGDPKIDRKVKDYLEKNNK